MISNCSTFDGKTVHFSVAIYTLGKVVSVFDGEEREQDHQLKDLPGRELAVRSLGKLHLPLVKFDMRHYVHDSLNRLRIVSFSKINC